MKAGPHPALAQGKVRYVGDHVAVVIAETLAQAKDAAETIVVDYDVLPAVVDTAEAAARRRRRSMTRRRTTPSIDWHLGDKAETDAAFAGAEARHQARHRQQPARSPMPMEPRAAVGDYDAGTDAFTLYTTSQNPHVARLVLSAFIGIAPEHKLRVIAPDVGGGFGSKIFIYAEETVCVWAAKKVGRPVKWTADRTEAFLCRRAWPRSRHPCRTGDRRRAARSSACASSTIANLGAYLSTFSSSVPTYLYAPLLVGPVRHSGDLCRGRCRLYEHRAGRRLSRRGPAGGDLRGRASRRGRGARTRPRSGRIPARRISSRTFPHQTPVIMCTTPATTAPRSTRRWRWPTTRASARARRDSAAKGKLRGIGFSAYIEACGIAPSAAVGSLGAGVGLWEFGRGARQSGRHGRGADRLAQPWPGP